MRAQCAGKYDSDRSASAVSVDTIWQSALLNHVPLMSQLAAQVDTKERHSVQSLEFRLDIETYYIHTNLEKRKIFCVCKRR